MPNRRGRLTARRKVSAAAGPIGPFRRGRQPRGGRRASLIGNLEADTGVIVTSANWDRHDDGARLERAPFDEFYERDYGRLVAAMFLVTGDADVARDSVDEALARAWERARRGQTIDCLGAWVRVVALNAARMRFRRRAVEQRANARYATSHEFEHHDVAASVDVQRALTKLPRRQREVTVLHYFLDLSVGEIAKQLRVSPGTVKTSLHRARLALAVALGEPPAPEVAYAV